MPWRAPYSSAPRPRPPAAAHEPWPLLAGLAIAAALSSAACSVLPPKAGDVARHAEAFEILALNPRGDAPVGEAESFFGHPITARAKVTDPAAQQRIMDIVEKGMGQWATEAKCFNPRHGIRAVRGGDKVEIAICYECKNAEISVGGETTHTTTGDVRAELDKEFAALGVKTAE